MLLRALLAVIACASSSCPRVEPHALDLRTPDPRAFEIVARVQAATGARVVLDSGSSESVSIDAVQTGSVLTWRCTNRGDNAVRVREIVRCDFEHALAPNSSFYGEGFTMLSQTGGTLAAPIDLGRYTDRAHYRLPAPSELRSVYGMATFTSARGTTTLVAFASANRFVGRIDVSAARLRVVEECEGLELAPHESWELEPLYIASGSDRNALLEDFAGELARRTPRRTTSSTPPTGWCSWYCFGPNVTAHNVADQLEFLERQHLGLRYVQIDDGYQPHMGDWLESGPSFGGHVDQVLRLIRDRGFEPALWVAPFIADGESKLFHDHPEWFVADEQGAPLRSDRVTFGGWRLGPWYALDGTHPQAQRWLEELFRTLREQWGVHYFKLDANFWGAIHGGRFHDPHATRVEAYRRGMQAILRGAGDAFVLGCNHPLWPSLGLIDGSRSSLDVDRDFDWLKGVGRESLLRNWQNGRLWWNDPDCVVSGGALTDDEFRFHATLVRATGGLVLAGDDLTKLSSERLAQLARLWPPTGVAARFDDERFEHGVVELGGVTAHALLNWSDAPSRRTLAIDPRASARELWSDRALRRDPGAGDELVIELPPHGGAWIEVTRATR